MGETTLNEERNEAEKTELLLGINVFDQPAEASGAKAWGNLITNLLFMSPGSIPSDPEMGCDIGKYEFGFIDDVVEDIEEKIQNQVSTYLPDVPLESIEISNGSESGDPNILYIKIIFSIDDREDNIAVVAAEKVNSIINFVVV